MTVSLSFKVTELNPRFDQQSQWILRNVSLRTYERSTLALEFRVASCHYIVNYLHLRLLS